ncbi:MAG: tetratricopeptide repeat protein [Muribaculaceae bacterium]|nr:tetratricopeptide repeat protein [Muribaculaceae bacterium]
MKHLIFILSLLFSVTILAQEQKVVVKTRGKIDAEGNYVPGEYVKGAFVKIKNGHKYVTNKNGEFFFSPEKGKYTVVKVSYTNKKGDKYQIMNFDELGEEYSCSETPKFIIISTPKEQLRDILETRYYFTTVLDNMVEADKDEIENFALERELSGVNTDIKHFYMNCYRDVAKKLVEDLSLRFSSIDYDQLNNFDREFFYYLHTYQFQKADSMFRTIEIPDDYRYSNQPMPRKTVMRLANYYDKAHILYASQFDLDMAAHYLGVKANLDVTNPMWQAEAAAFYRNYTFTPNMSDRYYERILKYNKAKESIGDREVALLLNNIGKDAMNGGDYQVAFLAYKKYIAQQEELHGENHVKCADANERIGDLLFETEIYDESLTYYLKALRIYEKELTQVHYKTMGVYPKLADVYLKLEDEANSKAVEVTHLLLMADVLGGDYSFSVNVYYALAEECFNNKNYVAAYDYYCKAIDVYERLGGNHYCIINSCNRLGDIYYWNNDNAQAMELYNRALALIENKLGTDCIEKAESLIKKATIYYSIGDYENTLKYSRSALDIAVAELGKNSPELAEYYMKIGDLYLKIGENVKALENFKAALLLKEEEVTDEDMLESLYDYMACIHYNLKEYPQSLYYFEKLLEKTEKRLPKDDVSFVGLYVRTSITCACMGEFEDAYDYCLKSLDILKKKKMDIDPDILEHYGDVLYALGRHSEAMDYWNKAIKTGGNKERIKQKMENR